MKKSQIISIIILAIIAVSIIYLLRFGTYTNDEWWIMYCLNLYNNPIQTFFSADQGQVWSWMIMDLLMYRVPIWFHFHPQQNILLAIVKGIDVAACIYLLSSFFDFSNRKVPKPLPIIMNTLLVFSLFIYDENLLILNNQHFKYIFNFMIGTTIWLIWFRDFIENKFLLQKNRIRDCIFAMIIALSGHIVNIPSFIMLLSLCIYQSAKDKNIFVGFWKLVKNIYPVILSYTFFMICYINFPSFAFQNSSRKPAESIIHYSITHFWDFTHNFISYIIHEDFICKLIIIIFFVLIGLVIFRKKINPKYFAIISGIFLGYIFFEYTLLTCGRTYYNKISYWFISPELTGIFWLYMLIILNIILGCLYKLISRKSVKIVSIIVCFFVINFAYPVNKIYPSMKLNYDQLRIQQIAIYKMNKVCQYYYLKNKKIYMPNEYFKDTNRFGYHEWTLDAVKINLRQLYKMPENTEIELTYQKIINEDDLFTKEEMENLDFNKIYDNNFVLKMPEPIYQNIQ